MLTRYLYNVFFSLSAQAASDTTSGGGAPWPALYLARAPESDPDTRTSDSQSSDLRLLGIRQMMELMTDLNIGLTCVTALHSTALQRNCNCTHEKRK